MGEITNINGEPMASGKTRVVLTYEHETGHLGVDGDLGNVDRVLSVLGQAVRYFEAVYRFQQAQIMGAQARQDAEVRSMLVRPH